MYTRSTVPKHRDFCGALPSVLSAASTGGYLSERPIHALSFFGLSTIQVMPGVFYCIQLWRCKITFKGEHWRGNAAKVRKKKTVKNGQLARLRSLALIELMWMRLWEAERSKRKTNSVPKVVSVALINEQTLVCSQGVWGLASFYRPQYRYETSPKSLKSLYLACYFPKKVTQHVHDLLFFQKYCIYNVDLGTKDIYSTPS